MTGALHTLCANPPSEAHSLSEWFLMVLMDGSQHHKIVSESFSISVPRFDNSKFHCLSRSPLTPDSETVKNTKTELVSCSVGISTHFWVPRISKQLVLEIVFSAPGGENSLYWPLSPWTRPQPPLKKGH